MTRSTVPNAETFLWPKSSGTGQRDVIRALSIRANPYRSRNPLLFDVWHSLSDVRRVVHGPRPTLPAIQPGPAHHLKAFALSWLGSETPLQAGSRPKASAYPCAQRMRDCEALCPPSRGFLVPRRSSFVIPRDTYRKRRISPSSGWKTRRRPHGSVPFLRPSSR